MCARNVMLLLLEALGTEDVAGVQASICLAALGVFGPANLACDILRRQWEHVEGCTSPTPKSTLVHLRACARLAGVAVTGSKAELMSRLVMDVPPTLYCRMRHILEKQRREKIIEAAREASLHISHQLLEFSFETHVSMTTMKKRPYCFDEDLIRSLPYEMKRMRFGGGCGRSVDTLWVRTTIAATSAISLRGPTVELLNILHDAQVEESEGLKTPEQRVALLYEACDEAHIPRPFSLSGGAKRFVHGKEKDLKKVVEDMVLDAWLDMYQLTRDQVPVAVSNGFVDRMTAPPIVQSVCDAWQDLKACVPQLPPIDMTETQPMVVRRETMQYIHMHNTRNNQNIKNEIRALVWWFSTVDATSWYRENLKMKDIKRVLRYRDAPDIDHMPASSLKNMVLEYVHSRKHQRQDDDKEDSDSKYRNLLRQHIGRHGPTTLSNLGCLRVLKQNKKSRRGTMKEFVLRNSAVFGYNSTNFTVYLI